MNILINFKHHLQNKQTVDHLTKLVREKLSRLISSSDTVRLFFEDINGNRGGFDKRCTLQLVTSRGKTNIYKSLGRNEIESLKDALRKFRTNYN